MSITLAVRFLQKSIEELGETFPEQLSIDLELAPQAVRWAVGFGPDQLNNFLASFPEKFTILDNGRIKATEVTPEQAAVKFLVDTLKHQGETKLQKVVEALSKEEISIGGDVASLRNFLGRWHIIFYVNAGKVGLLVHESNKYLDTTTNLHNSKRSNILLHLIKIYIEIGVDTKLTCKQLYSELKANLGSDLQHLGLSNDSDLKATLSRIYGSNILKKKQDHYSFNYSSMTKECTVRVLVLALLECKNYTSTSSVESLLFSFGFQKVLTASILYPFRSVSVYQDFVGLNTNKTWSACVYLLKLLGKYDHFVSLQTITGCLSETSEEMREELGRNAQGIKTFAYRNNRIFVVTNGNNLSSHSGLKSETIKFFMNKLEEKFFIKVSDIDSYFSSAPAIVKLCAREEGADGVIDILKQSEQLSFSQNPSVMSLSGVQVCPSSQSSSDTASHSTGDSDQIFLPMSWGCTGEIHAIFDTWGLISCRRGRPSGEMHYFNSKAHVGKQRNLKCLEVGQQVEYDLHYEYKEDGCVVLICDVRHKQTGANIWLPSKHVECRYRARHVIHAHIEILKNISWMLIKNDQAEIGRLFLSLRDKCRTDSLTPLTSVRDLDRFVQMYRQLFDYKAGIVKLKEPVYQEQVANIISKTAGFVGKCGTKQNAFFRASDLHPGDRNETFNMEDIKVGSQVRVVSIPVDSFPKLDDEKKASKRRAIIVLPAFKAKTKESSPSANVTKRKNNETAFVFAGGKGLIRTTDIPPSANVTQSNDIQTKQREKHADPASCRGPNFRETTLVKDLTVKGASGKSPDAITTLYHLMTLTNTLLTSSPEKLNKSKILSFKDMEGLIRDPDTLRSVKELEDRILELRDKKGPSGDYRMQCEPVMIDCGFLELKPSGIYGKCSNGDVVEINKNSIFSVESLSNARKESFQQFISQISFTCICHPHISESVRWQSLISWPQTLNTDLLRYSMQVATGTTELTNPKAKEHSFISKSVVPESNHVVNESPPKREGASPTSRTISKPLPMKRGSNSDHLRILMEVCLLLAKKDEVSLNLLYSHLQTKKVCHTVIGSVDDLGVLLKWYEIFNVSQCSVCLKAGPVTGKIAKTDHSQLHGQFGFVDSPQDPAGVFFTEKEVFMPMEQEKKCFVDYTLQVQQKVEYIAISLKKLPVRVGSTRDLRAVLLWKQVGPNKLFSKLVNSYKRNHSASGCQEDKYHETNISDGMVEMEDLKEEWLASGQRSCQSQTFSTGGIIVMKAYMSPASRP